MDILKIIENRVSIEKFSSKKIEKDIVLKILEAGRLAPSAKNRQPWRFIVIHDEKIKSRIKEAAFSQDNLEDAPAIIAVCTTNVDYTMPNGQLSYPMDLSFAAAFMMLQAESNGIGSHVITTFNEEDVKHILTVPHSMRVVLLLVIGYSETKPFPKERKPLNKITSFNHW